MSIGFLKGSIAFDKYKTLLKNKPQLPLNLPHKHTMTCTEGSEARQEPHSIGELSFDDWCALTAWRKLLPCFARAKNMGIHLAASL